MLQQGSSWGRGIELGATRSPWARLVSWAREIPPLFYLFVPWFVAKQVLWITIFEPDLFQVRTGAVLAGMSTGFTLLLVSPAFGLAGRRQVLALWAFSLVLTLVGYSDILHYRQFQDLTSVAALRYASQLGPVTDSVADLAAPGDLWIWADVLLLTVLLVLPVARSQPRLRRRWVAAGVAGGLSMVTFGFFISPRMQYVHEGNAYLAGDLGIVGYHLLDASKYAQLRWRRAAPTSEEASEARAHFEQAWEENRNNPSSLHGIARGKNVIFVQLESIQDFVLEVERDGAPLTPHLRALAEESVRFTHFFSQSGKGSTADAEFAVACSLLPLRSGAVFFEHPNGSFRCLPRVLREAGYATHVFHANRPDFWNRAAVYPHLGYDRFHSEPDYEIDEVIGLGLSDGSFLRQTAEKLDALPRPFYAFVNTLTSHHPFRYEELPEPFDLGPLRDHAVGGYYRVVHYTDRALGAFVEDLRARGILDESILVVYGDHAGLTRLNSPVEDHAGIDEDDEWSWFHFERRVPLLVRLPRGERQEVRADVAGQIDLAPTLLSLLGIDHETAFFLGRDLFAEGQEESPTVFYRGSAVADDRIYLSLDDNHGAGAACIGPGGALPREACGPLREEAYRLNELSRTLVERDLFSVLGGAQASAD